VLLPGLRTERDRREELIGHKASSGTVMDIRRGADTLWQRGRVSAVTRILDSLTGAALPGILVGLAGSTQATATDASGLVRFDRLAPGEYTLRIRSPELASLGVGASEQLRRITVADSMDARVDVVIAGARSMVAARCGTRALERGEGLIIGRIRGDSARVFTATVVALSSTPYTRLGTGERMLVDQVHESRPEVDGTFYLCGVPREATVRVRKSSDAPGTGVPVAFAANAVTATVTLP